MQKKIILTCCSLILLTIIVTVILVIGDINNTTKNKQENVLESTTKETDNEDKVEDEISMKELFANLELSKSYKKANSNNAIYTQRFGADPGVMEYNGRIYVYTTNDVVEYDGSGNVTENTYGLVKTINCVSSDDLVNWTDHGAIKVAGADGAATWASNSWAPCAAHKTVDGKEKFYLFFANGGNGISVLTSDTPTGPWEDPLGEPLITRDIPNCEDVVWLFDPAILIDDDGTGYLYFGGGIPDEEFANPDTARVVKLSGDLLSLDGEVKKIENVPYLFEDSGINKIDGKYYYSYCSNFSTDGNTLGLHGGAIQYMVGDNPMGPFEYEGEIFENPGAFFGNGGNNHHALFEFKGEMYIVYHARTVEEAMGITGNYRSPHIDKVMFNNGIFEKATGTYTGVAQLNNFNPYKEVIATTMSDNGGISVTNEGQEILNVTEGNWIKLSDVDFKASSKSLTITVKADKEGYIKVCTGSKNSKEGCYIVVPNTNGAYKDITIETDVFKGVKDLYFVFANELELISWQFETDKLIVEEPKDLKSVYGDELTIGMCLNSKTIDSQYEPYVVNNFTSITCENEMKTDAVLSKNLCQQNVGNDQTYVGVDFTACQKIIEYCVKNDLKMRYHTLIWQNQTPDWFFYEDYDITKKLVDKETMKKRMENFIGEVIAYFDINYPDLIYTIDVVNEAFNGDAAYKITNKNNKWYDTIGTDYVYFAFLYTKNALNASMNMKDVTLVYNDYSMLYKEKTVAEGLENIFKDNGANVHDYVDVIGFQGHIDIKVDVSVYTEIMKKYSDLGYEVQITELDVGIPNVKVGSIPTDEQYIEQGKYMKKLMHSIMDLKSEGCNISAVTLWGINDANSWRKDVNGYNAYGLLWNSDMSAKPSLRGFALCDDVVND